MSAVRISLGVDNTSFAIESVSDNTRTIDLNQLILRTSNRSDRCTMHLVIECFMLKGIYYKVGDEIAIGR